MGFCLCRGFCCLCKLSCASQTIERVLDSHLTHLCVNTQLSGSQISLVIRNTKGCRRKHKSLAASSVKAKPKCKEGRGAGDELERRKRTDTILTHPQHTIKQRTPRPSFRSHPSKRNMRVITPTERKPGPASPLQHRRRCVPPPPPPRQAQFTRAMGMVNALGLIATLLVQSLVL